jgi:hypothetical protein
MLEPTDVVAMAAAFARVGASIDVKLTLVKEMSSPPPPQAASKDAALRPPARGSMGTAENNRKALRREGLASSVMGIQGMLCCRAHGKGLAAALQASFRLTAS